MNTVHWLQVPTLPPESGSGTPSPKYEVGSAVVVYGEGSAYVGLADEALASVLLAQEDVHLLTAERRSQIQPVPGLPMTWEQLEDQVSALGAGHHLHRRSIGLGDLIAAITRQVRISECGSCARRRHGLNRIRVWGWWRDRPAQATA
ncbi:hypothetical protein AB0953_29610 [Streptomyces sp. NPDC046866]|uniref:hypothetical protein n=1 Tax=Streptomyces sp. NPDC046866 TaxID=3154921 RepID=UPI0034543718